MEGLKEDENGKRIRACFVVVKFELIMFQLIM